MLIELWESLRGYNKWIPTSATVQSSALSADAFGTSSGDRSKSERVVAWQSTCRIVWQDQQHNQHSGTFEAFEESPLYQLCDGDKVSIRFNPDKPAQFYLPGLLQSKLARTWKLAVFAVLALVVLIGLIVAWFGPNILGVFSH